MRLDVRHRDDRGLHAVIGSVAIFVLTRLWLSGELATWFALITGWLRGVESTGFSSATFAIVELATSLIYGVGAILLLAWSGILWLMRDIAAGVRMWRDGRDEPKVVNVDEPAAAVETEIYSDPIIDAIESLADAVNDIARRIDVIEAADDPTPAKPRARRTNA